MPSLVQKSMWVGFGHYKNTKVLGDHTSRPGVPSRSYSEVELGRRAITTVASIPFGEVVSGVCTRARRAPICCAAARIMRWVRTTLEPDLHHRGQHRRVAGEV